jgi:hypothetical protein
VAIPSRTKRGDKAKALAFDRTGPEHAAGRRPRVHRDDGAHGRPARDRPHDVPDRRAPAAEIPELMNASAHMTLDDEAEWSDAFKVNQGIAIEVAAGGSRSRPPPLSTGSSRSLDDRDAASAGPSAFPESSTPVAYAITPRMAVKSGTPRVR